MCPFDYKTCCACGDGTKWRDGKCYMACKPECKPDGCTGLGYFGSYCKSGGCKDGYFELNFDHNIIC